MRTGFPLASSRFPLYALVGAVGTLAHYAAFLSLLGGGVEVLVASFCGYVLGAFVNYAMNRKVTFRSKRPHREAAPRFAAVALAGLGLNLAIVALLHEGLGLHALLAQVVATGVCLVATYALNAAWSFASARSARTD